MVAMVFNGPDEEHNPDKERMLLAGRGGLYDGGNCSLCATTRGRGEQEEAKGKQGDEDEFEGTEDPDVGDFRVGLARVRRSPASSSAAPCRSFRDLY